jgi:hypothetical protein
VSTSSPVQVPGTQWNDVFNGSTTTARKTDGTLWAWGGGACGALGNSCVISFSSPIQVPGTQWIEIGGGRQHVLARKA